MEDKPLLILGTRTLAVEIADLASETAGFQVTGFVENMERSKCRERLDGLPIIWVDEVADMIGDHWAICGLATTRRNRFVEQVSAMGMPFATLIHPSSKISKNSRIGEGCIISPGTIIASNTQLESHVFVNRGVLIGHHTHIHDFATIQPGANIAGACIIGQSAFIGMGALVLDNLSIGSHSVVGAGAVVTKDVPDHTQVMGIPATIVKEDISGR